MPTFASFFSSNIFSEAPFIFGIIVSSNFGLILQHKQKYHLSVVDIFLLLFILYGALHLCLSPVKNADFLKLWEWVAIIVFYFFIRSINNEGKGIILYALITSGIIQSVIALGQLSGILESRHPYFPITGSFGNPGQLGGYLAVCFVASLGYLRQLKKRLVILWIVFVSIIIGTTLIITDSRAAWIATLIGTFFVFRKEMYACWIRQKKICISFTFIMVVLGSLLVYNYRPESANARILIWRVCGEMINDKPLFGHGVGSFNKNYMLYQADYFREHPESFFVPVADNIGYPYNEFLHITVELGLIGFIVISGLLVSLFCIKSRNDQEWIFKAATICLVVFSLFSYPSYIFSFFLLFPMLLGGSIREDMNSINRPRWAHLLSKLGIVVICIWAVVECIFYERASWEMKQAIAKKELGSSSFVNNHFGKLIHNLKFNAVYAEYVFQIGIDNPVNRINYFTPSCETYCDIGKIYFQRREFTKAESYYKLASWMIPTRIIPNYLLWRLYVERGDSINAEYAATKILFQPLKVDNTVTIRIKAEVQAWLNEHN
ncbi:O-antigen ligase family protein [Bacteroides sp. 224]|nr:O-antigen ligase family protein [Bacteroides sp. 224]